jgi:hypothetical protein
MEAACPAETVSTQETTRFHNPEAHNFNFNRPESLKSQPHDYSFSLLFANGSLTFDTCSELSGNASWKFSTRSAWLNHKPFFFTRVRDPQRHPKRTLPLGASGGVVGRDTTLQIGRSWVLLPMTSMDFSNWPNPSSRIKALRSTQPLTEMSTRIFVGVMGGRRRVRQPHSHLWAGCLENVETSASHNPVGIHSLLETKLYLFLFLFLHYFNFIWELIHQRKCSRLQFSFPILMFTPAYIVQQEKFSFVMFHWRGGGMR